MQFDVGDPVDEFTGSLQSNKNGKFEIKKESEEHPFLGCPRSGHASMYYVLKIKMSVP